MAKIIFQANIDFDNIQRGLLPIRPLISYQDQIRAELKKIHEKENKESKKINLQFIMETYYKKRTISMNNLMWALYAIEANEQNAGMMGDKEQMVCSEDIYNADLQEHAKTFIIESDSQNLESLKNQFKIKKIITIKEKIIIEIYKSTSMFNTVEMAEWINMIFNRLAYNGIELETASQIKDYWIQFRECINEKEILMYSNKNIDEYRNNNYICESCGKYIGDYSEVDHISTRASGVTTIEEKNNSINWLCLCQECHAEKHNKGIIEFARKYKHLYWKIQKAIKI